MNRNKLMPNSILIFLFSIAALVSLFVLYIYWYIEISSGLDDVVIKFDIDPRQVFESQPVLVIVVLSLLATLILTGLSMTFIYNQKMHQLYRLQNNFINNFTHELKTPVTSLRLYIETFLKHDLGKEDQTKYMNYMLRDVQRLSDNISNILDLGQIESNNFQDEFIELDVIDFVSSFYVQNAHLFNGLKIEVATLSEEAINILISPSLFEMLLINLATNALKYNESDIPLLKVNIERDESNVSLQFLDNGMGVARSQRTKIFKKFYQIGDSNVRSAKGSGLGLYLVQNIVRAHQGKIKVVSSNEIKGTTFFVTLPLAGTQTSIEKTRKLMGLNQ